jgi:hypothetical protein
MSVPRFLVWSNEEGAWQWQSRAGVGFTGLIADAYRFSFFDAARLCQQHNGFAPGERFRASVLVLAPEFIAPSGAIRI